MSMTMCSTVSVAWAHFVSVLSAATLLVGMLSASELVHARAPFNAKSTKSVASVDYTVATVKYPLAWVSANKR